MGSDKKLENYLERLDKALGQIPVGDRADIITEIRSHVLDAQDRDATKTTDEILASLGEPESTASRYLLERGLQPAKPSKTPMVKWLTIGFLGTVGMCFAFTLIIFWKFTPIVKVDENSGRVQILGGLIDVNEKTGESVDEDGTENGSNYRANISIGESKKFSGVQAIKKNEKIRIFFMDGKFDIAYGSEKLEWNCKSTGQGPNQLPEVVDGNLDFKFGSAKCEFKVPTSNTLEVSGENGKVSLSNVSAAVKLKMTNGKVSFSGAKEAEFDYDIKIQNGAMDAFESSKSKNAIPIQMNLVNGHVSKD